MSSFTTDQVGRFREIFTQFSDEGLGGIVQINFIPAVEASLQEANFAGPRPSHEYLDGEFYRICDEYGAMQWQQFFQVLIHLNLRQSVSPPPPPEETRRVQFIGTTGAGEEELPPPSYDQLEQDADRNNNGTLGRQLLRSVGGFFGLTEASQRGDVGEIGWQQFTERNLEDNSGIFNTISRRGSLRNRVNQPQHRPPSYPAITTGHSFDMAELGDDSDEDEMGLTSAPPPTYTDIITGVEDPVVVLQDQQYPAPTRPGPSQPDLSPTPASRPQDLIYDKGEAWNYYLKYTKAEKRLRQRRHQTDAYEFFGTGEGGPSGVTRSGSIHRERLHSADQEVVLRPKKKKKTKLQRQSTLIRTEVESLPSFWPVFIVIVSVAQLVVVIVLMALYNIAPIRLAPSQENETFPSLMTENDTNFTFYRSNNIWIGLTPLNLIRFGAKFSPCMRQDFTILNTISTDIRETTSLESGYGCCQNRENIGNTLPENCIGSVNENAEMFFERTIRCSSNSSSTNGANFHPCCISITGQCEIMDLDQCTSRGGFYHDETDSCDNVNCLRDICGFNGALVGEDIVESTGEPDPLMPDPQQFWRFFTATYVHLGIIHVVIILPIQLYVGIKIERTIGWLRIGIIYILSGVGGNLVSAIFDPFGVNGGASGAVFGLLGVLYVELFQFWQIVDRAWLELVKLTAFVVFLLALGTLPYVDNMAHIGGLLFGVPSAIIFVPYITFGKWDAARKRILLVVCVPLVFLMFLVGFLTFYLIKTTDFCTGCHYINCVPYVSELCPEEFSNPNATIFSL